jgi:hypothetical protein
MPKRFRDAEHLVRLALLFGAGALVFAVARALLVPEGFGELGHFRPGAIADNQARQPVHAGREACLECHDDIAAALAGGAHALIGCESCHGALATHVRTDGEVAPPELEATRLCALCHDRNVARPARHPQVAVVEHADGAACTDCHAGHDPAL